MDTEKRTYPSVETQKNIWPKMVQENPERLYSYGWGDPLATEARNTQGMLLGNYRTILKDLLLPNIIDKVVVDLGSYDGKWTQHMTLANLVVCVDLDSQGYDFFRARVPDINSIFYKTNGDELGAIADNSVDFIFSMDSLVRSEPEIIRKYIAEFKRVLKPDGKLCVHLPAQEQDMSHKLGFTQIGSTEIEQLCTYNGFTDIRIEKNIINHGILLLKGI